MFIRQHVLFTDRRDGSRPPGSTGWSFIGQYSGSVMGHVSAERSVVKHFVWKGRKSAIKVQIIHQKQNITTNIIIIIIFSF